MNEKITNFMKRNSLSIKSDSKSKTEIFSFETDCFMEFEQLSSP